jgi:hypothetical protein
MPSRQQDRKTKTKENGFLGGRCYMLAINDKQNLKQN